MSMTKQFGLDDAGYDACEIRFIHQTPIIMPSMNYNMVVITDSAGR